MKPTTDKQRRDFLRELANSVAAKVAPAIGLKQPPKCSRISRRRGYGGNGSFSVPAWAAYHPAYFEYYAAHEVCHEITRSHSPAFHAAERAALAVLGYAPIYEHNGRGPYVDALLDIKTGAMVCCVGPSHSTNFFYPTEPPVVRTEEKFDTV